MDHPKDQPLCLVGWTPRVFVVYTVVMWLEPFGNFFLETHNLFNTAKWDAVNHLKKSKSLHDFQNGQM